VILIGGTSLVIPDLPFAEFIEYQLENAQPILQIKLTTVAKQSSCDAVYILEGRFGALNIPDDVADKVIYFSGDQDLLTKLGESKKEDTPADYAVSESELAEGAVSSGEETVEYTAPVVNKSQEAEDDSIEVDAESLLQPEFLELPQPDVSANKQSLQADYYKQLVLQRDSQLQEMQTNLDNLYKIQEIQLIEMRETYEKRVTESDGVISQLRGRIGETTLSAEDKEFLLFAPFTRNPKLAIRGAFSQGELDTLGRLRSPLHIFASGAGDSVTSMVKSVVSLTNGGSRPAVIVDFTGDLISSVLFKLSGKKTNALMLQDEGVTVESLANQMDKSHVILSSTFNDIALLGLDWVGILKKLDLFAAGRPVILLFNSIISFSVGHTVAKLSNVGNTVVFVSCNPTVLNATYLKMVFMKSAKLKVAALDYIDAVSSLLEAISKLFPAVHFKSVIDWRKLDLV
jgi:hypothetical protein